MSQLRRLLAAADAPAAAPMSFPRGRNRHRAELLGLVEAAGLRGRGGGGFPVVRKLRAAAAASGRPVVVINAAESEPASAKDRTLLTVDPHLVLDGAQAAAHAIGATEVVVAFHAGRLGDELRQALAERPREVPTRVLEIANRYVASEASAIVSAATGGTGLPTTRRHPLAEGGPGGRPWLVQNTETLACVGLLARHGLDWYRQVGTAEETGTLLLTVRGAVRAPQVVELPVGAPLRTAVDCAGGLTEPIQAVLMGGFAGSWLPAATSYDVALSTAGLRAAGGTLGAGVLIALPTSACGLAVTAQIARYLADQSARQCGPCLNGLPALASALEDLVAGTASAVTLEHIDRWCRELPGRGGCSHPGGAVRMVRSALEVFAADVRAHRTAPCGRAGLDVAIPA